MNFIEINTDKEQKKKAFVNMDRVDYMYRVNPSAVKLYLGLATIYAYNDYDELKKQIRTDQAKLWINSL